MIMTGSQSPDIFSLSRNIIPHLTALERWLYYNMYVGRRPVMNKARCRVDTALDT